MVSDNSDEADEELQHVQNTAPREPLVVYLKEEAKKMEGRQCGCVSHIRRFMRNKDPWIRNETRKAFFPFGRFGVHLVTVQ